MASKRIKDNKDNRIDGLIYKVSDSTKRQIC